ncbi:MAG TPA: PAS domain-containing protein [Kineosporiaceae bacterium]
MAVGIKAEPTGIERVVAPDELFFSTTDRRGVIRSGNSVFVRISGYSLGELTGSPHSLVRHPDMPGGAFRLMWDRLLDGRPMGAFVQNLAKDGGHYWVFATVTPLGDGFLSVRLAPRSPLLEPARQLYRQVLAAEREAIREGADRRSAAALGARLIEDGVQALGFASYDDFIVDALPAEIASRSRLVSASYARSWARGPIADVLAGAGELDATLATQVEQLDAYRTLAERLTSSAAEVLAVARRLDRSVEVARQASARVTDTAPVLLNVATVMAAPMHVAVRVLEQLAARLARLRADVAALRFRIALASLHTDMVAAFAAEVADGTAPAGTLGEVPLLCDAVHDGVVDMAWTARALGEDLREAVELVTEAGFRLEEFRRFLGQWRILVLRHRAGGALGELLRPIDEELGAGHQGIELLRGLADRCRSGTVPMNEPALEAHVGRIRAAAASA